MKIGFFDPYLDSLSGGEKYILSAAACLAKDHEVFIFWNDEKEAEIRKEALRKLNIDLSSVKFYRNLFDKSVSSVARFFESNDFDAIVYLSDGSVPFVGTKLFVHFQFPVEWISGKSLKTKIKLFFVKKIFCNSFFTKGFIDKTFNIKSNVLYPPVSLVIRDVKKENVILHVGRFDIDFNGVNYKKQDVMVDIFKKMVDMGLTGWKLKLIVGVKNKDKEKLNKFKEILKGYPIELMVNISNQKLWENYSKAKIYWHTTGYGEDLQRYPEKAEHFGISTVEAMGAGCVPVVFNAGGQKEVIENSKSGYLCNDMKDFASKTSFLIKNEILLKKMSLAATKRSEMFSESRFCQGLKTLLTK